MCLNLISLVLVVTIVAYTFSNSWSKPWPWLIFRSLFKLEEAFVAALGIMIFNKRRRPESDTKRSDALESSGKESNGLGTSTEHGSTEPTMQDISLTDIS